ncbi:MAG TPA: hypothetical protein VKD71_05125 [Gemmataceae bacterium]|nr:hypothetical protein [Gemmataceae bacterium]
MSRADTLPILGPIAVLSLFSASCALPAGYYQGKYLEEGVALPGWWLLAPAWMIIPLPGMLALAWFANPALLAALVGIWRRKYRKSAVRAAIAVGLSVLPLALVVRESGTGRFEVRPEPAWVFPTEWNRTELRSGYFTWVASHGFMFFIGVVCWMQSRRTAGVAETDVEGEHEPARPRHGTIESVDCSDDEVR